MASSINSSEDDIISAINITPLVDVVLVLLVIFMITAPVIYQASLKVNLPKAKSGEVSSDKTGYEFALTKSGELLWDNRPIDWTELEGRLVSLKDQLAQKTAVISADRETPHGTVIRLIDTLKQSGLNHFALNVQVTQTPK